MPASTPGGVSVVLDERGESLSSMQLAKRLEGWRDRGVTEARFLIGAADGHEEDVRAEADLLLSFGPATWPSSEERRGGTGWVRKCRSRWGPSHSKKKNQNKISRVRITIE